jgi:hypothetical protein
MPLYECESRVVSLAPDSDLIGWRRARLLQAGIGPGPASRLAADPGFDLHELLGLIDKGCDPQLAARILAPLEESANGDF